MNVHKANDEMSKSALRNEAICVLNISRTKIPMSRPFSSVNGTNTVRGIAAPRTHRMM
jgi:hypothetical protein